MKYMIFFLLGSFAMLSIGVSIIHQTKKDAEWRGYERGAHAIIMHHKYYGDYGTMAYRKKAFEWGDPQTVEDLIEIKGILPPGYIGNGCVIYNNTFIPAEDDEQGIYLVGPIDK